MANLKVRVPIEIEDYKERILLGLSLRQLAWGAVALFCGVPAYIALKPINVDLATYVTMAISAPAFAMGFIRSKEGYTFEYIVKIRFKAMFGKNKRSYETEISDNFIPEEILELKELYNEVNAVLAEQNNQGGDANAVCKNKKRKGIRKTAKGKERPEFDLVEITKKGSEKQRKATLAYIKTAGRSLKAEKLEKGETASQGSRTENSTTNNQI